MVLLKGYRFPMLFIWMEQDTVFSTFFLAETTSRSANSLVALLKTFVCSSDCADIDNVSNTSTQKPVYLCSLDMDT